MRSTFTCLILCWALAMAGLVSCFRVPVHVVQYDEEPAITVAPVGTMHQVSASVAIMNPRVKDPALVGRLQPSPPSPVGGIDWTTVGITALGLLGPVGLAVSNLLSQLRKAKTANRELVQGAQAIKEQSPDTSAEISTILASKQSDSTKDIVKKIKAKTKKPQGG